MSQDTPLSSNEPVTLPLLPLRDVVVFPHMVIPLFVGREKSIRALDTAMKADKRIMLVAQKQADIDDPKLEDARVDFPRPAEFYAEFNRRFPGEWSAVSWQYVAILEMWRKAVERIQTVERLTNQRIVVEELGGRWRPRVDDTAEGKELTAA